MVSCFDFEFSCNAFYTQILPIWFLSTRITHAIIYVVTGFWSTRVYWTIQVFTVSHIVSEYWSAKHSLHSWSPSVVLYFPAAYNMHIVPLTCVEPAWQRRSEIDIPLVSESLFSGHELLHDPGPGCVLYFPRAQSTHGSFPSWDSYFPEAHGMHGFLFSFV